MTYQEIFNEHLKSVRLVCKASGNTVLANVIIGLMFDFSDGLKDNDLIKGEKDNDKENVT